jgi:hypothetical protein
MNVIRRVQLRKTYWLEVIGLLIGFATMFVAVGHRSNPRVIVGRRCGTKGMSGIVKVCRRRPTLDVARSVTAGIRKPLHKRSRP